MNGIKASIEGMSIKLEFESKEARYPLSVYFFKNEEIAWSTEIESSGRWCIGPAIRGLDTIVLDIDGNVVFRHDWKSMRIHESVEKAFLDWCGRFSLSEGRLPKGIVIGACDGISGEWVSAYEEGLIGDCLLIEPNAKPFLSLLKRYGKDGRFSFRKVAVGDMDGFADFYTDESERVESSSLSETHFKKHMHSNNRYSSESMKKISVRCVGAQSLLKDNPCDWIHIDAEGYDADIIGMMRDEDLSRIGFLIWEHSHISSEKESELERQLSSLGFELFKGEDSNSCAIKKRRI